MSNEHDTHGVTGRGWYGFDLDGTLAVYNGWRGIDHIGVPVESMCALARLLHGKGEIVKIVTARVAPRPNPKSTPNPYLENHWCIVKPDVQTWAMKEKWTALEHIQEWCWRVLGFVPEITHEKDPLMLWLFDDRTVQVETNTGVIHGRVPGNLDEEPLDRIDHDLEFFWCKPTGTDHAVFWCAKESADLIFAALAERDKLRETVREVVRTCEHALGYMNAPGGQAAFCQIAPSDLRHILSICLGEPGGAGLAPAASAGGKEGA